MRRFSEIRSSICVLAILILFPVGAATGQPLTQFGGVIDSFKISSPDTSLQLSRGLILPGSEVVSLDSIRLFPNRDYILNLSNGTLSIRHERALGVEGRTHGIYVRYKYLPFSFQSIYRHRIYPVQAETVSQRRIMTAGASSPPLANIFGPELQKSGSIFRGFTVGSNRDLTLNSGFRLQFAGKLSSDIDILAALTDENTPIQPEGNTQTLQELDKVFVEITSSAYEATLGDFYLDLTGTDFGQLSRKLQGARGLGNLSAVGISNSFSVAGATARGKFETNQFAGIEGVQGPYRLFGRNNARNIIVIAGTEKAYVDGILMTRGETNDYAIDYASGEITFSSKRLITGASRIVVDFQYTDRAFTRNFFALQSKSQSISNAAEISLLYTREGDDPNAPIDISLSDTDKRILEQSGSTQASRSGVDSVGVDSLNIGKGQYAALNTVIQGANVRFYRFSPGTPDAVFNITFSFVGAGRGDYIRESLGQYAYVGAKSGQYLPIVLLPSPQLQQLADVNVKANIAKHFSFAGEFAASSYDQNRFSSGEEKAGNAMKMSARYAPSVLNIAGMSLGSLDLSLSARYVNRNFVSLDRVNEVEFGRKWSLDSTVTIPIASEEIREARVSYSPVQALSFGGSIGSNRHGSKFSSDRKEAFIQLQRNSIPKLEYTVEEINSTIGTAGGNLWFRQRGSAAYTRNKVTPSVRFENEKRIIPTPVADSLSAGSFSFGTIAPKVSAADIYSMNVSAEVELRDDNAPSAGELSPMSRSITQAYSWSMPQTNNFSSSVDIIVRKKTYRAPFRSAGENVQTTLLRSQSRYAPFRRGIDADLFYEVSTQRSARLERVFYKVQRGEGQYVWTDGNGNGKVDIADETDFRPARFDGDYIVITIPGDALVPVVNLKSSGRLRLAPDRIIGLPATWVEKAVAALSTESSVRIEEKSSERQTTKIYSMDFSRLLNRATTILGSQLLQQDLFLFENRPDLSLRLRFQQRRTLGQYSSGIEQGYARERSLRIRLQLMDEFSNQVEYTNRQDNLGTNQNSARSHLISSDDLTSDYSYRPEQNVEVGFKLEVSQSGDAFPTVPLSATFNGQSVRTVFSFRGTGQLRIDFSREEVLLENVRPTFPVPFELTGGRVEGKTFLWSLSFDYRLSGNLQSTLQYTGRSEQHYSPVHTARAEVRAFF